MAKLSIILNIQTLQPFFKDKLGKNSKFFSYPFGEYSEFMRSYISKNFSFAFGQHSGVIDETKNLYELPRFPINEKYGELKRFTSLTKTLPFKYKKIDTNGKFMFIAKIYKEGNK